MGTTKAQENFARPIHSSACWSMLRPASPARALARWRGRWP